MAAGIPLINGAKLSDEQFGDLYGRVTDLVLFECLDDRSKPQGYALGKVSKRYKADSDGAFISIYYIQASDEYYRHWAQTNDAHLKFHHLCRTGLTQCKRTVGADEVVHIQKWTPISGADRDAILSEWGLKPLADPGILKGKRLEEEPIATAAKAHPGRKRTGDAYGLADEDFDESEESVKEVIPRKDLRGAKTVSRGGEGHHGDARPRARTPVRRPSGDDSRRRARMDSRGDSRERRRGRNKTKSALDAILAPSMEEDADNANEKRMDELRERLGQKRKEVKIGASDVLAQRIQDTMRKKAEKRKPSKASWCEEVYKNAGFRQEEKKEL